MAGPKPFVALLLLFLLSTAASAQPELPASTDCAEPRNANFSLSLAERANIVVTGLAASTLAPAAAVCANASTVTIAEGAQADGSQVIRDIDTPPVAHVCGSIKPGRLLLCCVLVQAMLFWVQCVNKGALVCRNNAEDDLSIPPRCLIAVRVPAQGAAQSGQLPPCTVNRGMR